MIGLKVRVSAPRLNREAEELARTRRDPRRRGAGLAFGFIGRETVDGQPTIVVSLTPRPNARVTTRATASG